MVHILIAVKPSERFPNKNKILANYTIIWLLNEIAYLGEEAKVYTVGYRNELPETLPTNWQHFEYHNEDHQKVLEYAESIIKPKDDDILILAQLTQPIRRRGLLKDVIESTRQGKTTITACYDSNNNWRIVDKNGRWQTKSKNYCLFYDGALYGWKPRHILEVFDKDIEHSVIINYNQTPIDIDYITNIPFGIDEMYLKMLLLPD